MMAPFERLTRKPHLVENGKIYLCDGIGNSGLVTEDRVRVSLFVLTDFPTIDLVIKSDGGDADEARNIYAVLRECGKPVRARIKRACSGAAVIAMAASESEIDAEAVFMIHAPATAFAPDGRTTASFLRALADKLDRSTERSVDIFARRTGLRRDRLWDMLGTDTYLDAEDAVRLGFCDRIAGRDKAAAALRVVA